MKLFDPYAAFEEIENQRSTPATSATFATNTPKLTPYVAKVANIATLEAQSPKNDADGMRHGFAINGNPKTWTGNIVSLDAWRNLSEWDRHGPNGRMWDGRTGHWETQE